MKYIIANWKMNKTLKEAMDFSLSLKDRLKNTKKKIVICPVFLHTLALIEIFKETHIEVGAQDVSLWQKGSFTGEVSALQLVDIGVKYCIVGHSERREYFKEDDEVINKKLKIALATGLWTILCVGERLKEREKGNCQQVVISQLKKDLNGVKQIDKLIVAYEPVWAIGTGRNATPQQAKEMHSLIKEFFKKRYNKEIPVIYGGSVNKENIKEFAKIKEIEGVLVGGASLNIEEFLKIVEA